MEDSINIGLICDEVVPNIPEGHTHLMITVPSKNYAILYRLTDPNAGMYQGEINDKMALFGENPNKRESRLFCSHPMGLRFVRAIAEKDERDKEPKIFEYNYDRAHTIVMPGNVNLDLAVNGSGTNLRKIGGKLN